MKDEGLSRGGRGLHWSRLLEKGWPDKRWKELRQVNGFWQFISEE
jgi:hypothetical protein